MPRLGISLPMLNTPLTEFPEMARAAEDAGFDSIWDYEFWRNPFVALAAAAPATERITLGTALAVALTRTPWMVANAAADIDELTQGRMVLGLGTGPPEFLLSLHGYDDFSKPVAKLREFVHGVRASWDYLATGEATNYVGEHYRVTSPPWNPWERRSLVRDRIPIYTAGVRPMTIQLAGEVSEGLIGYLYAPKFIQEVALPNLKLGADRAGRDPSEVEIMSYIICSVSKDRDEAIRRARIHVGMYTAGTLMSDEVVRYMGLEKDQLAVREALITEGPDCLERVTSDALVDAFSIAGTPDECRKRLKEYEGLLSTIILHTPYVPPLTKEESRDGFRQILETFAK